MQTTLVFQIQIKKLNARKLKISQDTDDYDDGDDDDDNNDDDDGGCDE